MKKALVVFVSVLSLICVVSCKPDPEPVPDSRISIDFDGQTYKFDYVYTSFFEGEGLEIIFSTNPELEDFSNDPGTHFEFEVPVECFNKTLTYGDPEFFGGNEWNFYVDFLIGGAWVVDGGTPSDGTIMNLTCEVVEGKVNSMSFSYDGTIDGMPLSFSFEGDVDFAFTDYWFF